MAEHFGDINTGSIFQLVQEVYCNSPSHQLCVADLFIGSTALDIHENNKLEPVQMDLVIFNQATCKLPKSTIILSMHGSHRQSRAADIFPSVVCDGRLDGSELSGYVPCGNGPKVVER